MDPEKVTAAVTGLRIKAGLRSNDPKKLPVPGWSIGFGYSRDHKVFTATCYVDRRSSTMGLTKEDVETRSKSMWMTDNTWRLSAQGIAKVSAAIHTLWNKRPGAPQ